MTRTPVSRRSGRPTGSRRRGGAVSLAMTVVASIFFALEAPPAWAAVVVAVGPSFESPVTVGLLPPAISTQVTPGSGTATTGTNVSDTATVTGVASGPVPTGTVTFTRFFDAPGAVPCSGPSTIIGPVTLTLVTPATTPPSSTASTPPVAAGPPGTFRFVTAYSGDANYSALPTSACGAPNENVTVQPLPTIAVAKSATPASLPAPGGMFTFDVVVTNTSSVPLTITSLRDDIYGDVPFIPGSTCTTATITVLAPATTYSCRFPGRLNGFAGTSQTDKVTVTARDAAGNTPVAQAEATISITFAVPTIATAVSTSSATLGTPITDTATLSGGFNPTGNLEFRAYGPDDATCTGPPAYIAPFTTVTGNNNYTSAPPFAPAVPGTYRFIARYMGDASNASVATQCNDPNEAVTVLPLTTIAIAKSASPPSLPAPGGTFTYDLVVTNTSNVALTITALADDIYGNVTSIAGSTCNTAIGTVLALAATYSCRFPGSFTGSAGQTLTDRITVRATDAAGNTIAASDDAVVTITSAAPTIATAVSTANMGVGSSVTDTATLAGGSNPIGTLVFRAYGPADATCAGPPAYISVAIPVAGNGSYTSTPTFTPGVAGTYRFIVAYSGDANNTPVTTACSDPNETVVVTKVSPTVRTTASPTVAVGAGTVRDTATLAGGFNPGGSITFSLYRSATCAGSPVFTSTKAVTGNGTYVSADFVPPVPGTYHWVASYSGDANNNAVAPTPCSDPAETVVVGPSTPTPCRTFTTGTVTGPVVVRSGQHRCFSNATVNGSITVKAGGELTVLNSIVTGGINSNLARAIDLCSNDIGPAAAGPALSVTNTTGPIRIGDPATACNGNNIRGAVRLNNNYNGLTFGSNLVRGSATIRANTGGPIRLTYNHIDNTLACSANTPPPTNAGQPNTAAAKTVQCSGL